MPEKPTYEELEQKIKKLEKEAEKSKRTEEALLESEERYRSFIAHSSEGIYRVDMAPPVSIDLPREELIRTIDEHAIVAEVNEALADMYGLKPEDMIGKPATDFAPNYGERASFVLQDERYQVISVETTDVDKNGNTLFLMESYHGEVERRHLVRIWGVQRDITARRHTEDALRESEDKLRAIFDNVNDEIIYLDSKGTVLDVNSRVETIFGYKPQEVIGKNFTEINFCHPDSMEILMKQFDTALSGSLNNLAEIIGMRKDGTEVQIETSTSIIKKSGNVKNILSVIRDVTERKKLEAQLQQAHKLEAIGNLAGGIAHEFNNILGIITGNTELAMDGVSESSQVYSNLVEIHHACLRARDVVRQILALSRQTQQELKPIKLAPIIKDSLKLLRSSLPANIEIRQNISGDFDTVCADPTQINQVLINLCANAAYAMRDEGGILEINLEDAELAEEAVKLHNDLTPGAYVKLTVRDTGFGIGPKILDRIFDPYFTTKNAGEGTGLGLAVVHGIVKNHGGDITVHSETGKGTSFQILLPHIESETEIDTESKKPIFRGNERILFLDDEESLILAAKNYLEDLGYEVITERDPIKALGIFKESPEAFDLVITDMTMPNMTGDRLAKAIMKIRSDMPVILCTGFSELISEEKAKAMGIKAFVMKPALVHEMAATIRQVLDQGKEEKASVAKRILIVDDEDQMRSMLRQMLKSSGYEISEAPDGKVALRLCKERKPDLIITDLIMPEKEGIETIVEIKRGFPEIKIIAISGGGQSDPEAYLALARKLGSERALAKPFEMKELLKAVESLLG